MVQFPSMVEGKPRALVGIDWQETSGVDHPANQEEGWLVMKAALAANPDATEELMKSIEEEERVVKAYEYTGELLFLLKNTEQFTSAPVAVKKSADVILDWLDAEGHITKADFPSVKPSPASGDASSPYKARVMNAEATKAISDKRTVYGILKDLFGKKNAMPFAPSKKASQEEQVAKQLQKAFGATWPAFCEQVAYIVKSDATTLAKQFALTDSIAVLSKAVEAALDGPDEAETAQKANDVRSPIDTSAGGGTAAYSDVRKPINTDRGPYGQEAYGDVRKPIDTSAGGGGEYDEGGAPYIDIRRPINAQQVDSAPYLDIRAKLDATAGGGGPYGDVRSAIDTRDQPTPGSMWEGTPNNDQYAAQKASSYQDVRGKVDASGGDPPYTMSVTPKKDEATDTSADTNANVDPTKAPNASKAPAKDEKDIAQKANSTVKVCQKCNAKNDTDNALCVKCGASLSNPEGTPYHY